jgi:RinA family phage transcriptional activator
VIEEKISKQQYMGWEADLQIVANIDHQIELRKLYLINPWREHDDDNIGGGRNSRISKPEERILKNFEKDKRLQKLLKFKEYGDQFLSELDKPENKELKKIYEWKFIKAKYMTWNDVGNSLGFSHRNMYRTRETLLKIWGEIYAEI